jgi:ELWxxDGT repeat protein
MRYRLPLLVYLFASTQIHAQVNQITTGLSIQGGTSDFNKTYFANSDMTLWVTDGTVAGTAAASQFMSEPSAAYLNGKVFFNGYDALHGIELWVSDGTVAGTYMLKDINPGVQSSSPGGSKNGFFQVGKYIYFKAFTNPYGEELWKTDGTEAGTQLVKDINPGTASSAPLLSRGGYKNYLDSTVYFIANDGVNGTELWKSDGTDAGTVMVKDISPGSASTIFASKPQFIRLDSLLFFTADDNVHGMELWRTNGTSSGTFMVKDVNPSGSSFDVNGELNHLVFKHTLYFHPDYWNILYATDGTTVGTQGVAALPSAELTRYGNNAVIYNDKFFFTGSDGSSFGQQIWESDGTPSGTHQFVSINNSSSASPTLLLPIIPAFKTSSGDGQTPYQHLFKGKYFFFIADNGVSGAEPWISDGTTGGTHLLKDINPGISSSFTSQDKERFFFTEDYLFMMAETDDAGEEPWVTDGTANGTYNLADVYPGVTGSNGRFLGMVNNNTVLFQANENSSNSDLFSIGFPVKPPAPTYTFTGNGNWSDASNWEDEAVPPAILPSGTEIIIDAPAGQQCVLNVPYTVPTGCKLTLRGGGPFIVEGNLMVTQ